MITESKSSPIHRVQQRESNDTAVNEIAELVNRYAEISAKLSSQTQTIPSSTMLQLMLYGDTFNVVTVKVEVDYSKFSEKYAEVVRAVQSVRPALKGFYYSRYWTDTKTIDGTKAMEKVNWVTEPAVLAGLGEFKLKGTARYNPKFAEALEVYVLQDRLEGYSFFDPSTKSLTIYSRTKGKQRKMTVADVFVDYYVLVKLEPMENGGVRVVFGCTCPHSRGETRDSRGRYISPEYTGMCKHVLATLYYFAPSLFAYLTSPIPPDEKTYSENLAKYTAVFDELRTRLSKAISEVGGLSQETEDETPARVILSNISYLVFTNFIEMVKNGGGDIEKLVPTVRDLWYFDELWKSIVVKTHQNEASAPPQQKANQAVAECISLLEKQGLYDKLGKAKEILNGLQGSVTDTLYTYSLLAGCLLGSNLHTDPTIVASNGDPGTGKTLTAIMLGELIGFRSIVIEREVSIEDVMNEAKSMLANRLEKAVEFFTRVIAPKLPESEREVAKEAFKEIVGECVASSISFDAKSMKAVAEKFAELYTSAYGIENEKLKTAIAKVFFTTMKFAKKLYENYLSEKAVEAKVVDVRRELLKSLEKLGIIGSAEEKERFNSGSVRWDVLQTARGYRVRVMIDLHYLLSKYASRPDLLVEKLAELSKLGKLSTVVQKGGVAEIKLAEVAYLEKMLRTREEDITGRLIWVGGEVTRKAVILLDEARRAPQLVIQLLTDLSTSAKDSRRTNLVVTADNAEAVKEAKEDPALDAFHSRINFEVTTQSTTVEAHIERALKTIAELDASGMLPLLTMDELFALSAISSHVEVPERFIQIAYSLPLLTIYDFKVMRPESARAYVRGGRAPGEHPLIYISPKGALTESEFKADYETPTLGEGVPEIMRKPERRFGHHVMRASRALAVLDKKPVVDKETFLKAVAMTISPRIAPANVADPYLFVDYTNRVIEAIVRKVDEVISKEKTATEKLIDVLGSMAKPTPDMVYDAMREMAENPVLVALFIRFLGQMLVSKKVEQFIEYAKTIPGLYETLKLVARYEKIPVSLT